MSALRSLSNRRYLAALFVAVAAVALTQGAGSDAGTAVLAEGFGWIAPELAGPGRP